MKKIVFSIAFLLVAFAGSAQEADEALREKTKNLIQITSGGQFDVVIKPLVDMVPEDQRAAFKSDIKAKMDDLYNQLTNVYLESYSEEEIDAILAFYDTPVGQKMIAQTPHITQKSMEIGQTWGMQLQPLLMKYLN